MTTLTVHLHKVTNLLDDAHVDMADPYVRFHLTQNNMVFDKNYGRKISSKKTNDMNPVYNEDFVWEEIPTLENMELRVRVMDDDPGRDEELGFCNIKLEKLDLSAEPLVVRKKIEDNFFSPDSWVILKLSYGDPVEDEDASEALSHVGTAAYEILRKKHAEHHLQLWNVTSGRVVGELHQTPKEAFPGITPEFPEGHDDWFPDIMGDILSRTKVWADVLSLSAPTGKFTDQVKVALAKIAESAAESEKPVVIRMLFGNIAGMPVNCSGVIKELTEDLSPDANIRLWVGAWRKGTSWNHAKIIAVDGKYLHTGGHNMWDAHYLESEPVHDLSLEMEGSVALDGHLYANHQWDFVETKQETFWGTISDKLPDSMPQATLSRVTVSEWPRGEATEHAPSFRKQYLEAAEPLSVDDAIPVITMGRYGTLTDVDRPADDAFVAMFDASQTVIRLALQDLGPVCIPSTKIALPGLSWPHAYLSAFGRAIWERGVDVEIVLSNPNSIPAGLSPMEANYGNGWSCNDVASEIIKTIRKQYPDAEDDQLREKVAENLRVCFIRQERGNKWENEMTIGMHAKHFIIDDTAMYIGSQNLYVCDLAEWGVLIDDPGQVQKAMEEYWNPLWQYSHTGEDVDVHEVMDGLDIDRDGADPSDIDDDMREKMKQAEQANYGRSGDLYEEE